jgi:hypothetical protein
MSAVVSGEVEVTLRRDTGHSRRWDQDCCDRPDQRVALPPHDLRPGEPLAIR